LSVLTGLLYLQAKEDLFSLPEYRSDWFCACVFISEEHLADLAQALWYFPFFTPLRIPLENMGQKLIHSYNLSRHSPDV
jgi:hypothetical protein